MTILWDKKNFFLIILSLIILTCVIYRIHFSINGIDESFYITLAYRFILGGKPFLDEYNLAQTAAMISYPFFKLFYMVVGSTDGIVLFARYLAILMQCLLGYFLFRKMKKIMPLQFAWLLALISLVFMPYNIYAMSYNTLGMFFITLALVTFYEYSQSVKKPFLMGCFFALAVLAYPTFSVAIIIALVFFLIRREQLSFLFYFALPSFIILFSLLIAIASSGSASTLNNLNYFSSLRPIDISYERLETLFFQNISAIPYKIEITCLFLAGCLLKKKYPLASLLSATIIIFMLNLYGTINQDSNYDTPLFFLFLGYTAPLIYLYLPSDKSNRDILLFLWLPGLLMSIVSGITSGNGFHNSCLGGFIMPFISFLFLEKLAKHIAATTHHQYTKTMVTMTPYLLALMSLFALLNSTLNHNYRDDKIGQLHYEFTTGPFKGLYSTEQNVTYYEGLEKNLKTISNSHKTFFFYRNLPVGYLLSDLKPFTNSIWLFDNDIIKDPTINQKTTLEYFKIKKGSPDYILILLYDPFWGKATYDKNDVILNYTKSHYHTVIENSDYLIYEKNA